MANIQTAYGASSAVTITLTSLATSASLIAGQESTAIVNTTGLYLDYLVAGSIMTGTTPTGGAIEVHAVGILNDTTWPDVFDGTNSAETVTSSDIKVAICRPIASLVIDTTSNRAYPFGPIGVASLFGATAPPKQFVIFVTHNTGVALNATATNHFISVTPVYATSA